MAISTPTNPDLPSSVLLPGVFLKLNLSAGGAGLNSPSKRVILIANKSASGVLPSDTAFQATSQQQVNINAGQGSDLARIFAAFVSQIGPGQADVYCLPISEPVGGTAATHLVAFVGTSTGSGSVNVTICGYQIAVPIASGDTPTIIAANVATAINTLKDIPVTAAASTGTVTLTYRHKGLVGNDLPRIVNVTSGIGVTASAGTLTYATNASSTGGITVSIGGTTVSYTVTNADTPTTTAAGVANAINAAANPVTATASSGVVTLFYATDRTVHRIAASMGTVTGQTVAIACGTLGAGAPALTTALANLGPAKAYPAWVTSFNDGGSGSAFHGGSGASSSIGLMAAHIARYSDGYNQKGQTLMFGATESLAVSGGYQTSTGVNSVGVDGEARCTEIWEVDANQQAYELAARAAAIRITQDYKPKNYAGQVLKTAGIVPLLQPHKAVQSGPDDLNAALNSYLMTPLAVNDQAGNLYIVRDRTTSPNSDQRLWSWGAVDVLDYQRSDLDGFLATRFGGKSFKKSAPHTPNVVTTQSIKEAVAERYRSYDGIDFVDQIDDIIKGLTADADPIVVGRVNIFVPSRIPVPLYQIGGGISLT